jgi:hypothetical protein
VEKMGKKWGKMGKWEKIVKYKIQYLPRKPQRKKEKKREGMVFNFFSVTAQKTQEKKKKKKKKKKENGGKENSVPAQKTGKRQKKRKREWAIENILQLPRMGYVDREQFSALASGPHKFPGRLYPFPRIRRWRLDFTPYILTLVLHSSLWRRERDRHASHFNWLLCLSSREADQERGVCSLAVFAPSTLSHAHLRPHFAFTKTVFFAISFSIRRLIVHRYVQFCFLFFSFGFF